MKQQHAPQAATVAVVKVCLVVAGLAGGLVACEDDPSETSGSPITSGMGPGTVDPGAMGPAPAQPAPAQPAPAQPAPAQPAPMEPTPAQPAPMEPAPMQPAPMEPSPIEPAPMEPMAGAPTFTAIYTEILTNGMVGNCMAGFCHGGGANSGNGNLHIPIGDQDSTYNNLVGVTSTSDMCGDGSRVLVVPNDSANSLLLQKLGEAPPCGMRMPVGPILSDAQMNQIATWIDMGAENN